MLLIFIHWLLNKFLASMGGADEALGPSVGVGVFVS